MSTTETLKLIGLDIASAGIVAIPASWTIQGVEDQIEFVIKVIVGITAIAMNIIVIRKARKKNRQ